MHALIHNMFLCCAGGSAARVSGGRPPAPSRWPPPPSRHRLSGHSPSWKRYSSALPASSTKTRKIGMKEVKKTQRSWLQKRHFLYQKKPLGSRPPYCGEGEKKCSPRRSRVQKTRACSRAESKEIVSYTQRRWYTACIKLWIYIFI
jgi:hypothetical protein